MRAEVVEAYLEEAVRASKKGAETETVKLKEKSEESQSMKEIPSFRNTSQKKEL